MISTFLAMAMIVSGNEAEDLSCLPAEQQPIFYSRLQQQAYAALERRDAAFGTLETSQQIRAYQQRHRDFFLRQLGGFPERTPLHAETVGQTRGDGYRVERVLYESRPAHHVTAALFIPDGEGPFPGVVIASGHSRTGKLADYNQRYGIALAKNGIAALCYDPIGQGERSQILAADGSPQFRNTTHEHFLMGVGAILVGTNTATYRVWDGIRSIDYLCSREEIDAEKIGFAGCSGGGTLTSYVMAIDDRVTAAAPACYLTTFARLIETIGPQDSEQNIFAQLAFGLDHPDYLVMRAPRPTLISATTGDFFDITGTWHNFRQAKRIYARLGYSERVDLVEADGGHGVWDPNLVATVRWMRRWLLDRDDAAVLPEMPLHSAAELTCTPAGQVLRLEGEHSVFDLIRQRENNFAADRQKLWETDPQAALRLVRETAGIRPLAEIDELAMTEVGRVDRSDYHIDKIVLQSVGGIPLPALTYHPRQPRDGVYLYLHADGKAADGTAGGPIEALVKERYVVVAVDLSGIGETATGGADQVIGDWKTYFLAYLLGKSLVGIRAEETLACARWASHYETETPRQVELVGVGPAGVVATHAAALEPQLFANVTLRGTIESWASEMEADAPSNLLTSTVHGALEHYDIPDLIRSFGPDKVQRK